MGRQAATRNWRRRTVAVQPAAADPHGPPERRLDAGEHRRSRDAGPLDADHGRRRFAQDASRHAAGLNAIRGAYRGTLPISSDRNEQGGTAPMIYELRTYECVPGRLPAF